MRSILLTILALGLSITCNSAGEAEDEKNKTPALKMISISPKQIPYDSINRGISDVASSILYRSRAIAAILTFRLPARQYIADRVVDVCKIDLDTEKTTSVICDDFETIDNIDFARSLPNLKVLRVTISKSVDLTALSKCPDLEILSLTAWNNRKPPTVDLSLLTNLKNLKVLELTGLQIKDPSIIQEFSRVEKLKISRNVSINNFTFIGSLPKLAYLDLSYTKVADVSYLKSNSLLEYILLDHSDVSNIDSLKSLSRIKKINIFQTKISDIDSVNFSSDIEIVWKLKDGFRMICGHEFPTTSDYVICQHGDIPMDNIDVISDFKDLKTVVLILSKPVDLSPLKRFKKLQLLDIKGPFGQDTLNLEPISESRELVVLKIGTIQLQDISVLRNLSNLEHLQLVSQKKIPDYGPLQNLSKLRNLELPGCNIGDLSPMKYISQLENLDLSHTKVSDITPINKLKNLETLYLMWTEVEDITALRNLKKLIGVDLTGSRVKDIAPLKGLTDLLWLFIEKTRVTDLSILSYLKKLNYFHSGDRIDSIKQLRTCQCSMELGRLKWNDLSKFIRSASKNAEWNFYKDLFTKAEMDEIERLTDRHR